MRICVDGSRIRNNKVAFSNLSGIVWTGPEFAINAVCINSGSRVYSRSGVYSNSY